MHRLLFYGEILLIAVWVLLTGPFFVVALMLDKKKRDVFDDQFGAYALIFLTVVPVSIWLVIVIMLKGK